MNLEEMRNEVMDIIQDRSYDPAAVTSYINLALNETAGVIDIPEFKRVFTVATVTDAAYINLGENISSFGGRVRRVKYDSANLSIYPSLEALMDDYEDLEEEGDIEAVALEGRLLWYAKTPEAAVNLLILCYTNPEPLNESKREVEWMPPHLHRKVIVNGAAKEIWKKIEEEDSQQPMFHRYRKDYEDGLTELRSWVARNRQSTTYSYWRY